MHGNLWRLAGLALIMTTLGPGCSGGDAFHEAGPLVLLSVEPVIEKPVSTDNLIPNPRYSEMYAGAPAPIGWVAPTDRDNSRIIRKPIPSQEGHFMIQQWWDKVRGPRGLADFFKTEMIHLKPKTRYRLAVTTINMNETSASVSVGQMTSAGSFSYLVRDLIVVEPAPKERRRHEAEFQTGVNGDVFICTHRNVNTTYDEAAGRAVLLWLDWSLVEVGPAA